MSTTGSLAAQLRRMRAMDYKYHALFFRYINAFIVLCALLLVAGLLEPLRAAVLLVPPLVLYAAMQGAFHFHYIIFARRFARALERKLDRGLIAHELEAQYLFPLDAPRFVGFSAGAPLSFFSAITLHYGIAGTLLWALALYRAWQLAPALGASFPPLAYYVPVMLGWTILNVAYLAWYFVAQRAERALEQRLARWLREGAKDGVVSGA